ncbi:MAG: hypothetical protein ACP5N2_05010 [Candidatus Nanoarchaeia archaeon]
MTNPLIKKLNEDYNRNNPTPDTSNVRVSSTYSTHPRTTGAQNFEEQFSSIIGMEDPADALLSLTYEGKISSQKNKLSTFYKGLTLATIISATTLVIGNLELNQDISEKLDPLREQFQLVANGPHEESVTENGKVILNYHGNLDKILEVKNQFAKDNNVLIIPNWNASKETYSTQVSTSTPGPIKTDFIDAYARLFGVKQDINTSAIDKYMKGIAIKAAGSERTYK